MASKIEFFNEAIAKLFKNGINILHDSRELKGISSELKLLAINGIVHAAKNNNNEGKSLITLSGFLSDLPLQIAPEIEELELKTNKLAEDLTKCSMVIKRLNQFSVVMQNTMIVNTTKQYHYDILNLDLLDYKTIERVTSLSFMKNMDPKQKQNIINISMRNLFLVENLFISFHQIHVTLNSFKKSIERASRNGLIAQYMGSNILIESSYLQGDKSNFISLVDNIKALVNNLDSKLTAIADRLNISTSVLSTMNKN